MYKEYFHIRILNNTLKEWLQSDLNNHLHKQSRAAPELLHGTSSEIR